MSVRKERRKEMKDWTDIYPEGVGFVDGSYCEDCKLRTKYDKAILCDKGRIPKEWLREMKIELDIACDVCKHNPLNRY